MNTLEGVPWQSILQVCGSRSRELPAAQLMQRGGSANAGLEFDREFDVLLGAHVQRDALM